LLRLSRGWNDREVFGSLALLNDRLRGFHCASFNFGCAINKSPATLIAFNSTLIVQNGFHVSCLFIPETLLALFCDPDVSIKRGLYGKARTHSV